MTDTGFQFIIIGNVIIRVCNLETPVKEVVRYRVGKFSEFEVMRGNKSGNR